MFWAAPLVLGLLPPIRVQERELVVMVEETTFGAWGPLNELARDFEARHSGLRVKVLDQGGAAGAMDKLKFMMAGDLPLDVARVDVTELAAFVAEGALIDLRGRFEADPRWDPGRYFPAPLAALTDGEGRIYGLPSTFTPYVMYANLDLLDEAGFARPAAGWTWDDFVAIARATTLDRDGDGRTDQYGVSLTQWLQAVVPWVWQNGGDLLGPTGERSTMGAPEFVGAMRFLRRLLHEERIASFDATFSNQLSQGLFQAGRAALYGPVGYWETYRFQHIEAFRWDVVPLPVGRRAATSIAMTAFVVPRTAREPDLAAEFVLELAGPGYQGMLARIGNGLPGLESAARSADFLKPDVAPESEHVFLDVMANARFMPPIANWRKIESICQAELEGILLAEDFDVAAACERMAAKTDGFLERERRRAAQPPAPPWALELAFTLSILALFALFIARRGPRPGALLVRQERAGYAMIALWAVGFLLFLFGPAVVTALMSLCEWSPVRDIDAMRWIGLDNYGRLASDETFHRSLGVTAAYAAFSVPLGLAAALGLALLLRRDDTKNGAVRTLCYLPAIISPVIVAAVWRSLFEEQTGLFNGWLAAVGIDGPAWLRDPRWVLPSFVLMSLWGVGAQMLVFLAALKAQDPILVEAARVDGAGPWRRFLHVTLPGISPVVLFNLVTGLILAAQVFAQPFVMTQGGPGDASRFLVLYLYESGFRHLDMGYASAIAWVMFVLLAVLCAALMSSSRYWVHYAGRRPS